MGTYYITGSSGGLGRALAALCLGQGHQVIGISRRQTIKHHAYTHITLDLSVQDNLLDFTFPQPKTQDGEIILVNNAGTVQPVAYAGEATNEALLHVYMLNMIAPAILSNTFIRQFGQHGGRKAIVHISSGAGSRPVDGWSAYCSTKAAINMHARVLAMEREKRDSGFMVAAIAPGIVDTDMQGEIRQASLSEFSQLKDFRHYKEAGMLSSPEEAAQKIYKAIQGLEPGSEVVFSVKN